jgi:nitrate/nitrite transport system ATP-binding protein
MTLVLRNISKGFGDSQHRTEVLHDINLDVSEGEFVAIVGYTGSGKTTLVKLMAGLLAPDNGTITFREERINGPSRSRGVVFQNYSLLPWLSVLQNVMLAVDEVYPQWSNEERVAHARKYIEMVSLGNAINKRPTALSGGMRQRVSLARTLAMNPKLLLMDEPLSALDAITRGGLQDEIVKIWTNERTTAVMITNDVDEGILMADRIIPLNQGPRATLGPAFSIDIERPRDKTALNDSESFISVRNQVIEYLMDMNADSPVRSVRDYVLPDVSPVLPGKRLRSWRVA